MKFATSVLSVSAAALMVLSTTGLSQAAPAGVLVIAENETPENLDPANATNSTVDQLLLGVYDSLVQFKAGELEATPRLAESWTISEDGRTYTFKLRDNVTFHDGSKLTAADVKFTLDRLKAANAGVMNNLGGYSSAEVIDDYTVALKLDAPFGPFIPALSRIYIVSKAMVEPHMGEDNARQWLAVNTAGSGPYNVTEYAPTEAVTLDAVPEYWGGWDGNHVATVVFRYVSEPSTQLALLQRGEVQIAPDVTLDDKITLKTTPGYVVDIGAAATPLFFTINTASAGPTGNPEFRRMLSMSFDRKLHLEQVLRGFGTLADGPLPPTWMGYEPKSETGFDLEGARALVEKNGWKGTTLTVRYLPAIQEEQLAVEQLQSNLGQLGITLKAEGMTWPAQAATMGKLETTADLNVTYSFPAFPDPHAILNTSFNGAFTGLKGGLNWSQYDNPKVNDLLNRAALSADPAERGELYREAQKLLGVDHVAITASLPGSVVALSDKVEGYVYNPAHHQTFNYMDIGLK